MAEGGENPTTQTPAPAAAAPVARKPLREENTIFIGRKSTMGYVLAVVTQFQQGAPEVKIKARGKIISQAVDVAEIVRRRFLPDVKVSHINIQTEDLENEDGTRSKVSSIEIALAK
jgi:DNA-binding protein